VRRHVLFAITALLLSLASTSAVSPQQPADSQDVRLNQAERGGPVLTARDVRSIVIGHVGFTDRGWRRVCRRHERWARVDWLGRERRRLLEEEAAQYGTVTRRMRREAAASARVSWLVQDIACHRGEITAHDLSAGHYRTAAGRTGPFHPSVTDERAWRGNSVALIGGTFGGCAKTGTPDVGHR
jgi:hypothetical protein